MSDLFDKYGHPIRVLIDPDCPQDLFDKSGRPHIVVENADGIDLSTSEFLPALLRGSNLLHIPTNAGWMENNAGSGSITQAPTNLACSSGVTASSRALARSYLYGFYTGGIWEYLNWDKKRYFIFNYGRWNSDSEVVARLQIKTTDAEGALSNKGLGIRVDNYALKGESYGTNLGVVDLGTTLASGRSNQIVIIHYPAVKIEWYVNGVLMGTQSTLANIPSGNITALIVHSIINGVTGGVDTVTRVMHPKLWQEA